MTFDQAAAHLEGMRNRWRIAAADARRRGEEYKTSANAAGDADLQRVQFEESSRFFGYAREIDRDAEALDIMLAALADAYPEWAELVEAE